MKADRSLERSSQTCSRRPATTWGSDRPRSLFLSSMTCMQGRQQGSAGESTAAAPRAAAGPAPTLTTHRACLCPGQLTPAAAGSPRRPHDTAISRVIKAAKYSQMYTDKFKYKQNQTYLIGCF